MACTGCSGSTIFSCRALSRDDPLKDSFNYLHLSTNYRCCKS
ncbi:hypothetical protein PP707_01315 [Acetobacter pasteurianus]|nr:hypothetical protein [Acetobacter pasteurianus]